MIQIKLIVALVALSSISQALGSSIKGNLEQAPATKGGPLLEGPAAKGKALERQQQQKSIEPSEELPKEQLKASQEELQVEEIRATKTGARKQEGARKEAYYSGEQKAATQQKLEEQPQQSLISQEKNEEIKQQRFEARPQVEQHSSSELQQVKLTEQAPALSEQVKLQQPLEQQKFADYDKQEIELRLPEEQRRIPEPLVQQTVYQQQQEEQEQLIQQVKVGAGAEAEPYSFSYAIDGSSRSESGDSKGVVRGQYTLQGADGSRRIVDYIADQNGFRASVNTNEFGTEARSPAGVALRSSQPSAEDITLRLEGKTKESLLQQAPQIQQLALEQYREFAVKGAPFSPAAPAAVKGFTQQQLPVLQEPDQRPAAPTKRANDSPARKELKQEAEVAKTLEESNKSAELSRREPKALKSPEQSRVIKEPSRSFESATAHRENYRPVVTSRQVLRQAPQPVRYQQVLHPQQPYLRQYPPSPVQAANYNRRHPAPVERDPRVSFYSSASSSSEEEQPNGFDSRSA